MGSRGILFRKNATRFITPKAAWSEYMVPCKKQDCFLLLFGGKKKWGFGGKAPLWFLVNRLSERKDGTKMAEWIFLAAAALLVTELYARTRRPKRYAVLNGLLGVAALLGAAFLFGESAAVSPFGAALSAVLGVPGAALYRALPLLL